MINRLIEAMNAASRRLEAQASLTRAQTESRIVIFRAFCAGAAAGVRGYSEAKRIDGEVAWRTVKEEADKYLATTASDEPTQ